jgi:surfeit locus 1 family protein
VVTFFLGVWQVYRLQWKLGLIEDTGRKLDEDPVELPSDLRFVDRPQRLLYGVKKEIY